MLLCGMAVESPRSSGSRRFCDPRQDELRPMHLRHYAEEIGLDLDRFREDLRRREHLPRIAEDVASADESGVAGTPSFFINGRRHSGAYDIDTLGAAVRAARTRNRSLRAVSGT